MAEMAGRTIEQHPTKGTPVVEGSWLIAAERKRQVEEEGWTPEHDDAHDLGALAMAAACYASGAAGRRIYTLHDGLDSVTFRDPWPFPNAERVRGFYDGDRRKDHSNCVNNLPGTFEARIDMLVKAGALIAAEIDRLQRQVDRHA